MAEYCLYLENAHRRATDNHQRITPIRSLTATGQFNVKVVEKSDGASLGLQTNLTYAPLRTELLTKGNYSFVYIYAFAPDTVRKRSLYIKRIRLPFSVEFFHWPSGNNNQSFSLRGR